MTRGSGKFEKGSSYCDHELWRIMVAVECRTSESGEKGTLTMHRPLSPLETRA